MHHIHNNNTTPASPTAAHEATVVVAMTTPHNERKRYIAQTTTEVKKAYKKNGAQLPEYEQRRIARGSELEERAARVREADERRRENKKKREEKAKKERAARRQLGVGLATQLCGYSHTQKQLKSGMAAFVGLNKKENDTEDARRAEVTKKLEDIAHLVDNDPWDDLDDDAWLEVETLDAPNLPVNQGKDQTGGLNTLNESKVNELINDTMLQAKGLDTLNAPTNQTGADGFDHDALFELGNLDTPRLPIKESKHDDYDLDDDTLLQAESACIAHESLGHTNQQKGSHDNPLDAVQGKEFVRIHGPINKVIEHALSQLPDPLIELLSVDCSTYKPWMPAVSLLHKLNPIGLPPHRLRLKVGCVVALLRGINTGLAKVEKGDHLRILRMEKKYLVCSVLDGESKGTEINLTQLVFFANYRNDKKFPFQRMQYPVRVTINFIPKEPHRESPRPTSKEPFPVPGESVEPPKQPSKPTTKLRLPVAV